MQGHSLQLRSTNEFNENEDYEEKDQGGCMASCTYSNVVVDACFHSLYLQRGVP